MGILLIIIIIVVIFCSILVGFFCNLKIKELLAVALVFFLIFGAALFNMLNDRNNDIAEAKEKIKEGIPVYLDGEKVNPNHIYLGDYEIHIEEDEIILSTH